MAKSSDGSSDDSTASTTNHSVKFRSDSPSSKTTKKNLAKAKKTKLYPLKFEYNLKTANVNIAQLHGKVLAALVDAHGDKITLYDKLGEDEIKLDNFPQNQDDWSKAFYTQTVMNKRDSNSIVMVGHQIAMRISITELKQGIHSILRKADGYIQYNAWDDNLDARRQWQVPHATGSDAAPPGPPQMSPSMFAERVAALDPSLQSLLENVVASLPIWQQSGLPLMSQKRQLQQYSFSYKETARCSEHHDC
jgi:hypothetical protein